PYAGGLSRTRRLGGGVQTRPVPQAQEDAMSQAAVVAPPIAILPFVAPARATGTRHAARGV
ncbi:hypothetical protein, partial [uncultured Microbacterium sp.]|uniref:hypothetical protein n=1 Tax=uncultured Microbacterium sp. TaxID=191216 RepID=UPI0026014460